MLYVFWAYYSILHYMGQYATKLSKALFYSNHIF